MKQTLIIGIAAGLASALLYGAMVTGSVASAISFYLAPLPLYVVGLGWGLVSAVAGIAAAVVITFWIAGFKFAGLYLLWAGVPALILIYLAVLSRPADPQDPTIREWYPHGRLFVWVCVLSTCLLAITIFATGPDLASFQSNLRDLFGKIVKQSGAFDEYFSNRPEAEITQAINFLVLILPAVSVGLWTISTWANLWLGAVVARTSGRLTRPWPPLSDIVFPRTFSWAFVASLAASFLSGTIGVLAGAFSTASAFAFILLGLATLHVITRSTPYRAIILGTAYAFLIFVSWIAFPLFVAVGLVESSIGLRGRFGNKPHSGNTT